MENQNKPKVVFTLSTLELLFISIWVGMCFSFITILLMLIVYVEPLKEKAVEKGYAEWVVKNNKNGETQFTWK